MNYLLPVEPSVEETLGYLDLLRDQCCFGGSLTSGIEESKLRSLISSQPTLRWAIKSALSRLPFYAGEARRHFDQPLNEIDEAELIAHLREGTFQLYGDNARSPYIPIAGHGPWLVTIGGAVIYDCGTYGAAGFGHSPIDPTEFLTAGNFSANHMTPSFEQRRVSDLILCKEVGKAFPGKRAPYAEVAYLNSGSQAVSLALRIAATHGRTRHDNEEQGKTPYVLCLEGGFHGRHDGPAKVSNSTRAAYESSLLIPRDWQYVRTVKPNDAEDLKAMIAAVEADGGFLSAMIFEPTMGEGQSGLGMTREFYQAMREETTRREALLIADSVQWGLRCSGHMSVVDDPKFEGLPAPDMETNSKAINAFQLQVSTLLLGERAAKIFRVGTFGNTSTGYPQGLRMIESVLTRMTDNVRENIVGMGELYLEKLRALQERYADDITQVLGEGLLIGIQLNPKRFDGVMGPGKIEYEMRRMGLNVIHGEPTPTLRLTPWFFTTEEEIDLVVEIIERGINNCRQPAA